MPDRKKAVFSWSSGKDSALALYHLLGNSDIEVTHLVTTINTHHQRVTMHGTPVSLLKRQLQSIGLSYSLIELPESVSMELYEQRVTNEFVQLKKEGITHTAYGDIFLEDLKKYREDQMTALGVSTLFPIWKKDTRTLIKKFIDSGFQAVVVCANDAMGQAFLGRQIDHSFVSDLPDDIDPCGENGEFHTFCYDGPIFNHPIPFELGERVKRAYPNPSGEGEVNFGFIDLIDKEPFSAEQG